MFINNIRYTRLGYRLLATVGELDGVGTMGDLSVGLLILAEVCAGIVVLDQVLIVVWEALCLPGYQTRCC